jgi:hypothetical protein
MIYLIRSIRLTCLLSLLVLCNIAFAMQAERRIRQRDSMEGDPACNAVLFGYHHELSSLLARDPQVSLTVCEGHKPILLFAVEIGNSKCVELLSTTVSALDEKDQPKIRWAEWLFLMNLIIEGENGEDQDRLFIQSPRPAVGQPIKKGLDFDPCGCGAEVEYQVKPTGLHKNLNLLLKYYPGFFNELQVKFLNRHLSGQAIKRASSSCTDLSSIDLSSFARP